MDYTLSRGEISSMFLTGLSGLPYSRRHFELSKHSPCVWGHRIIGSIEILPGLGGIVALIEVICAVVRNRFYQTNPIPTIASKIPRTLDSQAAHGEVSDKEDDRSVKQRDTEGCGFSAEMTSVISRGQGEYVLFRQLKDGPIERKISGETFDRIYPILCDYSRNRIVVDYDQVCESIHNIDPTLKVVFIPRTLFELFFIAKVIKSERSERHTSGLKLPFLHKSNEILHAKQAISANLFKIGYRLNKAIVKKLEANHISDNLTVSQIVSLANNEICYLRELAKCSVSFEDIVSSDRFWHKFGTSPFSTSGWGSLAVYDHGRAQIIMEALLLDCCSGRDQLIFLFRGADIETDSYRAKNQHSVCHSISFGTSLFAGVVFDSQASAFFYISRENRGYAIPIKCSDKEEAPFYVPKATTLEQLYGKGELFHSRTVISKEILAEGPEHKKVSGVTLYNDPQFYPETAASLFISYCGSNLDIDRLSEKFEYYKSSAFRFFSNKSI